MACYSSQMHITSQLDMTSLHAGALRGGTPVLRLALEEFPSVCVFVARIVEVPEDCLHTIACRSLIAFDS